MKPEKKSYLLKYIIAFLISIVIFILIFVLAYSVSYLNYQRISYESNIIKDNIILLDELALQFEDEFNCNNKILFESSERLDFVGNQIYTLESRLGNNDLRVLEQKKLYTQLEIQHFNIIRKLKLKCDGNFITVLFFYSNEKEYIEESEKTGFILNSFKKDDPNRIMIYSFDYNLDIDILHNIKLNYNITKAPIILINEVDLIHLNDVDELIQYLKEKQ